MKEKRQHIPAVTSRKTILMRSSKTALLCLLKDTPWKESYNQPRQHIEKQTLLCQQKVCLVKAMVFPGVMHGCESWTIKRNECQKIDGFELWCWRRLLRVPWTARRSNQSILKEISPRCSLEGLMLKLKLQYLWPPDVKS